MLLNEYSTTAVLESVSENELCKSRSKINAKKKKMVHVNVEPMADIIKSFGSYAFECLTVHSTDFV